MPKYWYIAAPFFNDAQRKLCEDISVLLTAMQIEHHAPHRSRLNAPAAGLTDKVAMDIKNENIAHLVRCTHVLAVLDYMFPAGTELFLKTPTVMRPLSLPDTGVSWEMGFATARAKKVLLFTTQLSAQRNLMLTTYTEGVVTTLAELKTYLETGKVITKVWLGARR
jgi:nucleoside 2-deoxyribosyltransferase